MFDEFVRELYKDYSPLPVVDPEADRLSKFQDAVADRKWFKRHPRAEYRDRAPSALEIAARALPPGSTVRAVCLPDGTQFRIFAIPKAFLQSSPGI